MATSSAAPARVYQDAGRNPNGRQRTSGDPQDRDPALAIDGMPPNYGEHVLPHIVSFTGLLRSIAQTYRASDEALADSQSNARFMRNDSLIMECLEQRQRSCALLGWHIQPDDENSREQKLLCDQLAQIVRAIPNFLKYRLALLEALWYGKGALQQRYRWKYLRGQRRLTIDNWLPIHADKVVFRYDDGGPAAHRADQIGIRVGGSYTEGQSIRGRWQVERVGKIQPTDYGLAYFLENWERPLVAIHKHLIEDGEFEVPERAGRIHGVGIRDRIYWTWYQKQEALAWLVEYLERSAFGIELWSYPAGNPEAYEKTRKAAQERIGNGRNTVLVPVWPDMEGLRQTVQRIEPGMAGVEALDRLLREYFGHAIKRYILGQTLTSEAAGTGLGSNLASIHLDTYLQIVRFDACNLEESLTTELVQPLLTFNFPQHADIPLRFKIETESPDVEGRLSSMLKAFEMGLKIPAKDVAAMLGIARPEEGDDVLQNAQARQSASMAAEGQQPGGLFRGLSLPGANGAAESDQETPSPDPRATERSKAVAPPAPAREEFRRSGERKRYRRMESLLDRLERLLGERHRYSSGAEQPLHQVGDEKTVEGRTYRFNANHRWERATKPDHPLPTINVPAEPFGAGLQGRDLQEAAFHWAMDHLRGKRFVNRETGREIQVSRTGLREVKSRSAEPRRLKLLYVLPELIAQAAYSGTETPRYEAAAYDRYHYFMGHATIDAAPVEVDFVVGEDHNGDWFYQFGDIKESERPVTNQGKQAVTPARTPAKYGPFKDIIGPEEGEVKKYSRESAPDLSEVVRCAAAETERDPSDAQKESGNYRKGKCSLHGLRVAIETPAGAVRRGVDRWGKPWSVKMPYHYGYILRTNSEADGDHVDVFLGPDLATERAYVIDQCDPGTDTFDEHKVMLGFAGVEEAKRGYLAAYQPGWRGLGHITELSLPQLRQWVYDGDTSRPIANQELPADDAEEDVPGDADEEPDAAGPERYRQVGESLTQTSGHTPGWKTVGGGARVFIDDGGVIRAGCAGLKHEDLDDLGEDEEPEHRQRREHRQEVAEHHGLEGHELSQRDVKNLEQRPHPETGRTADGERVAPPSATKQQPAEITVRGRRLEVAKDGGFWFFRATVDAGWTIASPEFAAMIEEQIGHPEPEASKGEPKGVEPAQSPQPAPESRPVEPKKEPPKKEAPSEAPSQPVKINPKTRLGQAILATAEDYGVAPDDLADALQFVLEEKQSAIRDREVGKQNIRKRLGLTAGDLARVENAGYDYATAAAKIGGATGRKLAQLDSMATALAREHPELALGDPDRGDDVVANLWQVIREGAGRVPQPYDDDVLREAANLALANRAGGGGAPEHDVGDAWEPDFVEHAEEDDAIPFRRLAHRVEVERYRRWRARRDRLEARQQLVERFSRLFAARGWEVERFARHKAAKGQGGLFREEEHPRDDSGKFSETEGGGTPNAIERKPQGEPVEQIPSAPGQRDLFSGEVTPRTPLAPVRPPQPAPPAPKGQQHAFWTHLKTDLAGQQTLFATDKAGADRDETDPARGETKPASGETKPPAAETAETPPAPKPQPESLLDDHRLPPPETATPREVAQQEFVEAVEDQYLWARVSKVPNAGEDLLGSARHRANAWRTLEDAEANGTAEELVTREQLLRNEPPNLLAHVTPSNALASLAMHLALRRLPPAPGGKEYQRAKSDEKKEYRRQYLDAYRTLKTTAEELATRHTDPHEALGAFRAKAGELITDLRKKDRYNPVANALVATYKAAQHSAFSRPLKTDVMAQVLEFAKRLKDSYGEPTRETLHRAAEHVKDLMEGKSLNQTFGTTGEKGQQRAKTFDPADAYVTHAARHGGQDLGLRTPHEGTEYMLQKLKLRGVQWGNYVTDEERAHHAVKCAEALSDLAETLGIPEEYVSLRGKLGLSIGARGTSNSLATYHPDHQVINLTRTGGVGSLAHEWGHFFDHVVKGGGLQRTGGARSQGDYLSNSTSARNVVREQGPDGKEEYRRIDNSEDPMWRAMDGIRKAWGQSGFRNRLSAVLSAALREGTMSKHKANYWTSNHETFARCFERYVQRKLDRAGRSNTYLAGTSLPRGEWWGGLWPTDSEVDAMTPAFDALFAAFHGEIEKKRYRLREHRGVVILEDRGPDCEQLVERFSRLFARDGWQVERYGGGA